MRRLFCLLLLPILMAFNDVPLADPTLEARAQMLMDEIRGVACENEPISQSGAEIAGDMRQRVRMMVEAGETDAAIRGWFADRYGEFVLFRPPATGASGLLLWGLPFGALLLGIVGLTLVFWQRRRTRGDAEIVPVAAETFDASRSSDTSLEN
jgi:cytochrome c-type biogenesis protein CcmH